MAAIQLGMNAVMDVRVGGVAAAGSNWVEVGNSMDVTMNIQVGEANVTVRASRGWVNTEPTQKDVSIEFEMIFDPSDTAYQILRDAFFNRSLIGVQCLNGPVEGSGSGSGSGSGGSGLNEGEGLLADMKVFQFNTIQNLEDAIKKSVVLRVARSDTVPTWINGLEQSA